MANYLKNLCSHLVTVQVTYLPTYTNLPTPTYLPTSCVPYLVRYMQSFPSTYDLLIIIIIITETMNILSFPRFLHSDVSQSVKV